MAGRYNSGSLEGRLKMNSLCQLLLEVGNTLGFDVRTEVQASDSAYVDLVWFDKRLPIPTGKKSFHMRYAPVLPVVGFEIELHTGLNAKHVKGSVSNLSNLGAQLGVIALGEANLTALQKQLGNQKKLPKEIKQTLRDRVYRWVYAEAQPKGRIIVMFEDEVIVWVNTMKAAASSDARLAPVIQPITVQALETMV